MTAKYPSCKVGRSMSFRTWLRVFFFSIVIIPMLAVAFVLFKLTADSETGRADAGIAAGLRNAFAVYSDDADRATSALRRVAADPGLRASLMARDRRAARARMNAMLRRNPRAAAIAFYTPGGRRLPAAGSPDAVAPKSAPLTSASGRRFGTLSVSVTYANAFVNRVHQLSGREVSIFRGGRRLASTLKGARASPELADADQSHDFKVAGNDYRGRVDRVHEAVGPPVEIAVFREAGDLDTNIADSRLLIGVILAAVLLGALGFSALVVRALQNQIGKFLEAAKRLAHGDFEHPVPTAGHDEFAALGHEFNSMSEQLAAKIDEVERKRRELEETIRRVGDAFASGLNPQQVAELTVQSALDACEGKAGRVVALDSRVFRTVSTGTAEGSVGAALEAAEKAAFRPRPALGKELMEADGSSEDDSRRAFPARVNGAHAIAVVMGARLGSGASLQYVGVVSVARHGREFKREEEELLEYLAGQAVVSIENASLHETVQRQAVTDELTGLSNLRELHAVLDREIERSRRFASSLGLVMLDIDNFKRVNDHYGHQQGDKVLAAVASVLREHSRDIDEPARYGGEELAVVLPQTDSEGAAQLAERMREAVEGLRVSGGSDSGNLSITASFGVASIPDTAADKGSLIAAADAALYRAKRGGKNRVERAGPVRMPG
jgi:diguanylate cyclase (GGDEF)-like protein